MTRPPLASLRRLYAVGGAPAASHGVLSRAPGGERLLEPLARVRVAHETSFDALTRPLDVGGVLSRFADAAASARRDIANPAMEDGVARRAAHRQAPLSAPGARAVESPAPAAASAPVATRHRPFAGSLDSASRVRRTTPAGIPAVAIDEDYLKRIAELAPSSQRRSPTRSPGELASVPTMPRPRPGAAPIESRTIAVPRRQPGSSSALAGANARVIVAPDVASADRLLAVAASASVAAPAATRAAVQPSTVSDAARLLSRAVERVDASAAATNTAGVDRRVAPPTPGRSVALDGHRLLAPERAPEPAASRVAELGASAAPATEPVGGFRGLAQRTLVSSTAARAIPVRRIEPETRLSIDVATDTLDARVADSLARVLEREARRHGIDLAEARA